MLDSSLEEENLDQVGDLVSIKEKCEKRFKLNHQEAWSGNFIFFEVIGIVKIYSKTSNFCVI